LKRNAKFLFEWFILHIESSSTYLNLTSTKK
jgi:hypothetical protein